MGHHTRTVVSDKPLPGGASALVVLDRTSSRYVVVVDAAVANDATVKSLCRLLAAKAGAATE